ncbi:MAG TPA: HAD-IB family hydrolase [Solirubrobacterales bacterium]
MGHSAAFFDLDKTLMAGSSGMHFARAAARTGMISRRQVARWGADHVRYRLRGATDDETDALLAQIKELLSGTRERDIAWMAPEVLAGIIPRIYPRMLDEVRSHQEAGRPVFIVSAAGNELVSMLAFVLAMDGGIGTAYAVDEDGMMTGELDGPFMYGEGKVTAIERFADEHDIDLSASYAYSDSVSDLPMLRRVGNAVVVNPDRPLAEIAKAEGWRVMRFEKLGRRLTIAAATAVAASVGWGGSALASRRRPRGRLPGRRAAPRRRRR